MLVRNKYPMLLRLYYYSHYYFQYLVFLYLNLFSNNISNKITNVILASDLDALLGIAFYSSKLIFSPNSSETLLIDLRVFKSEIGASRYKLNTFLKFSFLFFSGTLY